MIKYFRSDSRKINRINNGYTFYYLVLSSVRMPSVPFELHDIAFAMEIEEIFFLRKCSLFVIQNEINNTM